jgi:ADP-heptose:LPS heptosyltransferase
MLRQMRTAMGKAFLGLEHIVRRVPDADARSVTQVLLLEYQLPLGCCIHLSPLFEALKLCRPGMRIVVATRGLGAEVLRHSPFVDAILITANPFTNLSSAVRGLRRGLRGLGFKPECVLTGFADQRSRISLLAMLGSSGWRGGYTQTPVLYQRPLVSSPDLSHIDNNLQLARLLGCAAGPLEPRVFFSTADRAAATELLREVNPEARPLIAMVTQTSGGQRTGWRTAQFVEVIQAAKARGYSVVYLGTAADQSPIAAIREASGGTGHSLAGRTSVPQLAAVLAMSDAVISLDTGTMHVGRAVGAPMVVLGPSWQKPLEWMPLGLSNVRILRGEDRDDIPPGYQLDEIDSASVIAAMDELMSKYPPSAQARQARIDRSLSEIDHLQPSAGPASPTE